MDNEVMTNEENYAFDVAGYLILKGALKSVEVDALNAALDDQAGVDGMLAWPAGHREPFRDLLVHPVLVRYLNQICGTGFRLEHLPRLLTNADADTAGPLTGGDEPRDQSRAYYHQNDVRRCQFVRAIWTLEDVNPGDGGLVVVPCSHKENVETPEDLRTGRNEMGLVKQLVLEKGDLLLLADTVVRGFKSWKGEGRMRLLDYGFAARGVINSAGTNERVESDPNPEWKRELTDVERAATYLPGYRHTTPPPTIEGNTETSQVASHRDLTHPSIYRLDPGNIDLNEFYFWDLNGYLVIRDIMSQDDIELANEAIDRFSDRIVVGNELARGSKSLAGTGRPILGALMELPKPYCEPFRRMVGHPAITHRLTWMGGSGFRCGGPTGFLSVKGSTGHALHDANEPLLPSRSYIFKNGRSYCEAVTVAWQLRDVTESDGGFACVPGSHKAQYRLPPGVRSCDDPMDLVVHPTFKAGDVLFFMDGAQTHGALAWDSEISRRGVLIKYSSRNFNRSGGERSPGTAKSLVAGSSSSTRRATSTEAAATRATPKIAGVPKSKACPTSNSPSCAAPTVTTATATYHGSTSSTAKSASTTNAPAASTAPPPQTAQCPNRSPGSRIPVLGSRLRSPLTDEVQ